MAEFGLAAGYQNLPSGNWVPAITVKRFSNSSGVHRLQKL